MFEGFKKVRLTDENGLNGETAWAYGRRDDRSNLYPYNLYLILNNDTAYFPNGTELILQEDGYNVDMVETKRLAEAKALIERYHSCEREKDVTSTVAHELIRDRNLAYFLNEEIEIAQGKVKFLRLEHDDHDRWLVGKNLETGEEKRYSDYKWIANKMGLDSDEMELLFF